VRSRPSRTWPAPPARLADVASAYGASRTPSAAEYRFPIPDGGADLVLAKSLFTHLLPDDATRYLAETRRVLRPGKAAVVTAFLYEPSGVAAAEVARAFPIGEQSGRVRWRSPSRPASAVAYAKPLFTEMIESAGLHVQWHRPGYYPGSAHPAGQDVLLVGH
jgi:SAM-dependent methyltransferase